MNNEITPPLPSPFDPSAGIIRASAIPQLSYQDDEDSPLVQYLTIVRRRIWIILGVILLSCLFATYLTYSTTPLYRATTVVQISRESSRVVKIDEVQSQEGKYGNEFYQTQYGLMRSRSVATAVVAKLRLADNPTLLVGYSRADPAPAMALSRQARSQMAVALVMAHTQIDPERNSGLVNMRFDSPDKRLAASVANALAETYIETNLQRRFDANSYARNFLETELARVRTDLETSEQQVVAYADRANIIEINRSSSENGTIQGQSLSELSLEALNTSLANARSERIAAESRANARSTSSSASDPGVTVLRQQRAQLQAEYAGNLTTLRPEYPGMLALQDQISSLDRSIAQQVSRIGDSVNADYRAALSRERQLEAQVSGLMGAVQDLSQRRIQYNIFQRDADTNRALYDTLLERYKEIGVAGGIGANNIAIVDTAQVPGSPFTPQALNNLLLALIAGSIAGIGLAFLLEQLDGALKTPADVERQLHLPILGVIPEVSFERLLDELADRKSVLSEAYLSVQTALRFSTSHGVPKTLSVTSANESEGKSTTALSVAVTLARMGRRSIIIDADMRNPSLHKSLGIDHERGLADLLAGDALNTAKIHEIGEGGFFAMTSGPIPPNPAELLASDRLSEVLAHLGTMFDHVIIDTPPVLGLSDAPLIASQTEATVFVITSGATGAKSAIGSLRRLHETTANVIGVVLTRFATSETGYSYNYNYRYSYGAKSKKSVMQRLRLN